MTQRRIFSVLKFLFFMSLGVALLWFSAQSLSSQEIQRVKETVLSADLLLVIPCLLTLVLSHFVRALRWKMMLHPLGYSPKTSNVFHAVITGYFFNLLFPRLGEVMKCTLLSRYEKLPVDHLLGTIVAERIIDLLCLLAVIFLTIVTQMERVSGYASEILNQINRKMVFSPLSIGAGVALLLVAVFIFIKMTQKKKWLLKFTTMLKGLVQGLTSIRYISHKKTFLVYTLLIWVLYLSSIRIGFWALEDTAALGWRPALTILTFGSFAMIATQGGIGAYQLVVQQMLGLYAVNAVTGLAFGWLLWSVQTVLLFVMGPVSLLVLYLGNKKRV